MSERDGIRRTLSDACVITVAYAALADHWLWSVRWPAKRAGPDTVAIPQMYRYGHEPTREEAERAALDAHALGRPERLRGAQYVKA